MPPALLCVHSCARSVWGWASPFAFSGGGECVEQLVRVDRDSAGVAAFVWVVGRRRTPEAVSFLQVAAGLPRAEFSRAVSPQLRLALINRARRKPRAGTWSYGCLSCTVGSIAHHGIHRLDP